MRILLTGTSGQVGGAFRPLLEDGNELLAPKRAELDLASPATLAAALDRLKPELLINPAAYTAVDRAEDEADLAFRVNAEAASVIARWAARHRVPLVHFSTDYIFDGSGDAPWREDAPTGPLSVYGASKLAGERAIAEAGGASFDRTDVVGLRSQRYEFLENDCAVGQRTQGTADRGRPDRRADIG